VSPSSCNTDTDTGSPSINGTEATDGNGEGDAGFVPNPLWAGATGTSTDSGGTGLESEEAASPPAHHGAATAAPIVDTPVAAGTGGAMRGVAMWAAGLRAIIGPGS